ncbi:MAG: dTDP-4-amino-4,6-dideoxygalactose transaminase [Bacteroidetes bacterium]|nr:dTDP-4-amino-4,6-dideoxygalactose transaminase [Bacteroidota bacterium]
MNIPLNIPGVTGAEIKYIEELLHNPKLFAGRRFMHAAEEWMQKKFGPVSIFMTTSGTTALELAALAMGLQPGDEVIMPSYTFVSTANAMVLQKATPVFVDIRKDTMNIDETLVEAAITSKTKAIVAMHYAGISCNMEVLAAIAHRHGLLLLEDNAQGLMASYNGKALGTFGDLSTISFNYTKHLQAGEAGTLVINNKSLVPKVEIAYEAGTNRREFLRKETDFYEWKSSGSKYFPSEIVNAFVLGQLEMADEVVKKRISLWELYYSELNSLSSGNKIDLPHVPGGCHHNAHIFYIKTADREERKSLAQYLNKSGIQAVFHYVPLHTSEYGRKVTRFHGKDNVTTIESSRLLRLPLYHTMERKQVENVANLIKEFYRNS